MLSISKVFEASLIGKGEHITRASLRGLRILGVDEVGCSEELGSMFMGFYITSSSTEASFRYKIFDSKQANKTKVIKMVERLPGFKHVEKFDKTVLDSKLGRRFSRKILFERGLSAIPKDMYDVIVIDGYCNEIKPDTIPDKPILKIPDADKKFYSVAAASLIAKKAQLEEQELIKKYFWDNYGVDLGQMNIQTQEYSRILFGLNKFHKRRVIEEQSKADREEVLKLGVNMLSKYFQREVFSSWPISLEDVIEHKNTIETKVRKFLDNCKRDGVISTWMKADFIYRPEKDKKWARISIVFKFNEKIEFIYVYFPVLQEQESLSNEDRERNYGHNYKIEGGYLEDGSENDEASDGLCDNEVLAGSA